jgi:hypothetical protein
VNVIAWDRALFNSGVKGLNELEVLKSRAPEHPGENFCTVAPNIFGVLSTEITSRYPSGVKNSEMAARFMAILFTSKINRK